MPIDIVAGEERNGIDVVLNPVTTFQISGTVEGPPESWTGLTLRLIPKGLEHLALEVATALVGVGGRFTFLNVPAGDYTIDASHSFGSFGLTRGPLPATIMANSPGGISQDLDTAPGVQFAINFHAGGRDDYWARQAVPVGGRDESGIIVTMRRAGLIAGRVVKDLDPNVPIPEYPNVGIQLDPADGTPGLGSPGVSLDPRTSSDEFTIQGLFPGQYFLRTRFGWIVKSISWNGRDYTDSPFNAAETQDIHDVTVVVTNAGATLTGLVRDAQNAPAQDALVVVFPATSERWSSVGLNSPRIRLADGAQRGQFEIANLPAGEYAVIAVRGPAAKLRIGPEFFKAAASVATRVSLSLGRTESVNLVLRDSVR